MGIFDFLKPVDINAGVEQYKATNGAVLLDVRTGQEYKNGHIEKAVNLPLQDIERVVRVVKKKDVPVFTYCHSGARSRQAEAFLKKMGYSDVTNIGGIAGYKGKIVR